MGVCGLAVRYCVDPSLPFHALTTSHTSFHLVRFMQGVNNVYRDWKAPNIVWDAAQQLFKVIDFGYMQSLAPTDMESFSDAGTMGKCNMYMLTYVSMLGA